MPSQAHLTGLFPLILGVLIRLQMAVELCVAVGGKPITLIAWRGCKPVCVGSIYFGVFGSRWLLWAGTPLDLESLLVITVTPLHRAHLPRTCHKPKAIVKRLFEDVLLEASRVYCICRKVSAQWGAVPR